MGNPNDEYDPFDINAQFRRMSPIERKAYLVKAAFDRGRELDPLPATLRAQAIKRRHASQSWAKRAWSTAEDLGSIAKHNSPVWWGYHLMSGSDDEASDGLSRIVSAVEKSFDSAFSLVIDESLDIGRNLIHGIVSTLKTLAEWAAVGTVGGLAIGAYAGDAPEGMYLGFELAMTLGGYWALKDLLLEASKHLDRFTTLIGEAAELAWFAGEDGVVSEQHDINDAAKMFASAIVELWWVFLNVLIIWVMRRAGKYLAEAGGRALGGTALAKALGDIKANVASKFGTSFGEWFEKNFEKIQEAVDKRENKGERPQEGDSGGTSDSGASEAKTKTKAAAKATTTARVSLPKKLPFKLPKNPEDLSQYGFKETSHPKAAAAGHRTFENPQTGEKLRFDEGDSEQDGHAANDHYHRYNPSTTGGADEYLDADGNPCARGSDKSHLYPEED